MNLDRLQSLYDFQDRTVLMTGGSGVLGLEIVRTILACNANVVILSRNRQRAVKSVAESINPVKSQGLVLCVYGDVLKVGTLQEANETVKAEFGAVDVLVNAAGGNHPSATTSTDLSFFDLPVDALRRVGDLNLLGTVLPCQVFGRTMAERGEGVIVNVSSMNAFRPLTRILAYSRQPKSHWIPVRSAHAPIAQPNAQSAWSGTVRRCRFAYP
jgi:NAD(P)-dependent dehydrogenase (short-subunit alcohol dehydrogenase family)